MIDTCHYPFVHLIDYITPRENLMVNYCLWVLMMCQYRFIIGKKKKKKGTILVSDVDKRRSYALVRQGVYEKSL